MGVSTGYLIIRLRGCGMSEYRDLEVGEVIQVEDEYYHKGDHDFWASVTWQMVGRLVSSFEYKFQRPIKQPSPLLDSAESGGEGVEECDKFKEPHVDEIARLKGHLNTVRKMLNGEIGHSENSEAMSFFSETYW